MRERMLNADQAAMLQALIDDPSRDSLYYLCCVVRHDDEYPFAGNKDQRKIYNRARYILRKLQEVELVRKFDGRFFITSIGKTALTTGVYDAR